jgi:hypothetical protein
VHDGAVGADRPPDDIVCVLQINDDGLGWSIGFGVDLAHADVLVGLERLGAVSTCVNDFIPYDPHTQFCHDIDAGCVFS